MQQVCRDIFGILTTNQTLWEGDESDLRVRPGDQTPEPSMEESDIATAEERTTTKVQNQSNIFRVKECPLRLLVTGQAINRLYRDTDRGVSFVP